MGLYEVLRKGLFQIDAEKAHHQVMGAFSAFMASKRVRRQVESRLAVRSETLKRKVWGLEFENPLGMAAGFDKDGKYFNALAALGFGHVEIGTVTGEAQPGNERPRLFRLPEDEALLNRMGFNNLGSKALAERLEGKEIETLLGINFGKSKAVGLDEAAGDYEASLRRLHRFADYLVVNVSSPNTEGLRRLQGRERLSELLKHLSGVNRELAQGEGGVLPLLVKISPDLSDGALDDVLAVIDEVGLDGIIATNTTVSREGLKTREVEALGNGGISGRPLRERSRARVKRIYDLTGGELPIVGVGGVFTGEDAYEMLRAGASLVQIWTGFVYGGPLAAREILEGLRLRLEAEGVKSLEEIRGN